MNSDDFLKKKAKLDESLGKTFEDLEKGYNETVRVRNIVDNTRGILDNLDNQFCQKTGLTKADMVFLFTAIGLQISRQYLLTKFPQRLDDQTAANNTLGHEKEKSNRLHRYYQPSLDEIITNPVPFDANIGANSALSGGGKLGHRVTAIGHDPILGLIFGTANIATSTLTTAIFKSYHISTNEKKRYYFKSKASTKLVLSHTLDKLIHQGIEGKTIIATSIMKEIIHLKSDVNTKHSLPLPGISAINPKMASKIASYGFDMSNLSTVVKQSTYSILINSMIAMIHRMFCESDKEIDIKLHEVRTRKIISYSNLIASSSNIAVVAATQNMELLDLGGLAVTIYRLITDRKFIRDVKEEFIFGAYKNIVMGDYLI